MSQEEQGNHEVGESTLVREAREAAREIYGDVKLSFGQTLFDHVCDGVAIAHQIRPDDDLAAAGYLCAVLAYKPKCGEWLAEKFGKTVAALVTDLDTLHRVSDRARTTDAEAAATSQPEVLRRMVLALCGDLRVVILFLASRLGTMQYLARHPSPECQIYGEQTLALYSPLANRLGIWQVKGDLEDLSLRFTRPDEYRAIALQLAETKSDRIEYMHGTVERLKALLAKSGIKAEIYGRPKHIYSIWKKMQAKHLRFDQLYDVRASRIIVGTVEECYTVLSLVQEEFELVTKEFDDYIAHPKPNGYQSLHTVIRDSEGRCIEVQIRTRAMHEFAELGVAAHWRYKEAGNSKGGSAAEAERVAWLRQLLAWKDDVHAQGENVPTETHIYALTPQGRVVELPIGATPIDFAYALHTQIGHRCRGARVNGQMVPLTTPLATGQTVEIQTVKEGGPSRDWMNPDLGYTVTPRARSKVRQYFNALRVAEEISTGRDRLDKELARLGKTAVKLEDLANKLGFETVDELCIAEAHEEISLRMIEQVLAPPKPAEEARPQLSRSRATGKGGVLVVGVDSLLTQLARCCHPAPPDPIIGFVTRGRGVSVHRCDCPNIRNLSEEDQERLIEVDWGVQADALFPVDVFVLAADRTGLLKDVTEVFSKAQLNIVSMKTQTVRGDMQMTISVEVPGADALRRTLAAVMEVKGVYVARRK